jgi:hypothetical protein
MGGRHSRSDLRYYSRHRVLLVEGELRGGLIRSSQIHRPMNIKRSEPNFFFAEPSFNLVRSLQRRNGWPPGRGS